MMTTLMNCGERENKLKINNQSTNSNHQLKYYTYPHNPVIPVAYH